MRFTGYKEDEMELSIEFIKMYGVDDNEAIAKIIGSTGDFVKSIKEGRANLNLQQFTDLLKVYGISEFKPQRKATQREKRMCAMITNLLKLLYQSM